MPFREDNLKLLYTMSTLSVFRNDGENLAWSPQIGEEAFYVVDNKLGDDHEAKELILQQSTRILQKCVRPDGGEASSTGLVVGYVQSGKTLSFTTVAALANDNGYRLIIVIAGMTKELSKQSYDRLIQDLGVERTPFSKWAEFFEPTDNDVSTFRDVLNAALDEVTPPEDKRTVIITLKKNHIRLSSLNSILEQLHEVVNVPCLIIDDEADQASLNALVRKNELSTTYSQIRRLRELLPMHTFLQYTATPQAPLLINIIDVLSPDFAEVIEPGIEYVGGESFFTPNTSYIEDIPASEISTQNNLLVEPPESLIKAMSLFFIGVASGYIRRDSNPRNRSMMVHPTHRTVGHAQYYNWVREIRQTWIDTLRLDDGDADKAELLEEFSEAHADIALTVNDLEPFNEEFVNRLLLGILNTELRMVNSLAQARNIRWRNQYSWILVGGQVLDRGFTVEGLTVTYMPRGPGVGNADTVQQRARFLGYKRSYLGFCRVFLESNVSLVYSRYVRHEEDLRNRLMEHISTGESLSDFRRVFLLDSSMRPTRQAVIDIDYIRPRFSSGWYNPAAPHEADVDENRSIVQAFINNHANSFVEDEGSEERLPSHRHLVATTITLLEVYEQLLAQLQFRDPEDSPKWLTVLILIDRFLSTNEDAACAVFQMRPSERISYRSAPNGKIANLFPGAYPDTRGAVYRGDRYIRQSPVTVQLHRITLRNGPRSTDAVIAENVAVPGIWMSSDVQSGEYIVQPQ